METTNWQDDHLIIERGCRLVWKRTRKRYRLDKRRQSHKSIQKVWSGASATDVMWKNNHWSCCCNSREKERNEGEIERERQRKKLNRKRATQCSLCHYERRPMTSRLAGVWKPSKGCCAAPVAFGRPTHLGSLPFLSLYFQTDRTHLSRLHSATCGSNTFLAGSCCALFF